MDWTGSCENLGDPGQGYTVMISDAKLLFKKFGLRDASYLLARESGCDGCRRKRGSEVPMTVDAWDQLLTVHLTPTNEQERTPVFDLCEAVLTVQNHKVERIIRRGWSEAIPGVPG